MNEHALHPLIDPETPDLRILPIDVLVEHEYNDAQRTAPLAKRLEAEGLLKNPPIATPLGDDSSAGSEPAPSTSSGQALNLLSVSRRRKNRRRAAWQWAGS